MKNKLVMYSVLSLLGLSGIIGVGAASAHGLFGGFGLGSFNPQNADQIAQHQQTIFQNEANLLGISVDDVKNAWAQGKSLKDLAQQYGISQDQLQQKINNQRTQNIKDMLQSLVSKGIITQTQADQRLQFMQDHFQNKGNHMMHGNWNKGQGSNQDSN